jgi:hypothetical protein
MKRALTGVMLAGVLLFSAGAAFATPSTQIWIPSTDIQAFGTFHIDLDTYVRVKKSGGSYAPIVYDAGVLAGVLPFQKMQAEAGVDYICYGAQANGHGGTSEAINDAPVYLNAKVATPGRLRYIQQEGHRRPADLHYSVGHQLPIVL